MQRQALAAAWRDFGAFIELAIKESNGEWTAIGLMSALDEGRAQLYVTVDAQVQPLAFCVCEIWRFPAGEEDIQIFVMTLAGGRDLGVWAKLKSLLEREAIKRGCTRLRIIGRPGWERTYPDMRRIAVVLEKSLGQQQTADRHPPPAVDDEV